MSFKLLIGRVTVAVTDGPCHHGEDVSPDVALVCNIA